MIASKLTLKDIDQMLLSLELRLAHRRGKLDQNASIEDCIYTMQRKQNLGMNAILAVSLAMARGVAHLRGQNLFEIIREEIISIITRLAKEHNVEIKGGQFNDYVLALREVDVILSQNNQPLFKALHDLTKIYNERNVELNFDIKFQGMQGDKD
jgi:enolase